MTVEVVADTVTLDFVRGSAPNARAFLMDLRNGRSPIVVVGDEGGTVEIDCDITEAGFVFMVRKPGEPHHCTAASSTAALT